MKRTILTEEGWRRVSLPDVLRDATYDDVHMVLKEFNKDMERGRHSDMFMADILGRVRRKWSEGLEDDIAGNRPFHRDRRERLASTKNLERRDKTSWYRRRGFTGVLKV